MPAVSEAQRRLLYATKGADWVKKHHFDNKGKLPEHVPGPGKKKLVKKLTKKKHGNLHTRKY
jgi:hypothetical protein